MRNEGHAFNAASHIPKLTPPSPLEKFWLTAKSMLFVASDKDKERLGF